jgi:endo-1,4-beta-xylanase
MPSQSVTRRDILAAATAVSAAAVAGTIAGLAPAVAAAPRIPFGAAANHYHLPSDAPYRAALAQHCDVLVAEGAMKWPEFRPARDTFNFTHGDALVQFARQKALQVRGHTLVWCEANPPWVKDIATAAEAERELRRHIERVVSHYKSSISDWDVVNEAVAEKPRNSMDTRSGIWPTYLGERYIDIAFRAAADVAPTQRRVLNEYGMEGAKPQDRLKRAGFRRLILDLKSRGVPLTAIGLQAHLDGAVDVDTDGITAFCQEMSRAGLEILITELDVNDFNLPGDIAARDAIVAKRCRDFLSAVLAGCRPKLICTWGLTDRYTWMPTWFKRHDGLPNRALPFDANYQPKPMWQAIQDACRAT